MATARKPRYRKLTQSELITEAVMRFGSDPMAWAFTCPACGDVATGQDIASALQAHPRADHDGQPLTASDLLGRECIGVLLGALEGPPGATGRGSASRGCDWVAYGLIRGPWEVIIGDDVSVWCFPLGPPPVTATAPAPGGG